MKIIEAVIDRAEDGFYSAYCKNEIFTGGGETAELAKRDLLEQMNFYKQTALEDGFSYPKFLDEPFEIEYKFDTESLLTYYSGILSLSGMERITGIHRKQLWSYLHGRSKPRKAQVQKIEKALHALGAELSAVSL